MRVEIDLLVHLEAVPGGSPPFTWWAESPQVPGLSVAGEHLQEVLDRAAQSIPDVLAEQGRAASNISIHPVLSAVETGGDRGPRVEAGPGLEGPTQQRGASGVRRVTVVAA